jgi:Ca2+-dependent lipid-binding protein
LKPKGVHEQKILENSGLKIANNFGKQWFKLLRCCVLSFSFVGIRFGVEMMMIIIIIIIYLTANGLSPSGSGYNACT